MLLQEKQILPNMEFGRRMAVERELEKSEYFSKCNISKFHIPLLK